MRLMGSGTSAKILRSPVLITKDGARASDRFFPGEATAPDLDGGGLGPRSGGRPHLRIQNVWVGDDR